MNWYYVKISDDWAKPSRATVIVEANDEEEAGELAKEHKGSPWASGSVVKTNEIDDPELDEGIENYMRNSPYNTAFWHDGEKVDF